MQSQTCQRCAAGTYSLGTGVAFDEWDGLPPGFVTHGVTVHGWDARTDCSKLVYSSSSEKQGFFLLIEPLNVRTVHCFSSSTWTPKGDYVASNTDECTATLSYAVSLKTPGTVTFDYVYPDSSIYFEFFVSALK